MTNHDHTRFRRHGRAILIALALLFTGAVILQWSWNGVGAELFSAPAIRFKHAVAVEMSFAVLFVLHALAARAVAGGAGRRERAAS